MIRFLSLSRLLGAVGLALCLATPLSGQADHGHGQLQHQTLEVPLYDNLGSHHHAISTRVEAAQRYFDQGVRLTYAFNHAEAIRSFSRATQLDPSCAMCWWGLAWAYGPNINAAIDSAGAVAGLAASRKARELVKNVQGRERAYVDAMAARYGPDPSANRAQRDSAYANAMREVADQYPDDPDAQVLAAEALMLLSPWDYWAEQGEPKPATEEILARLESVTEHNLGHAGACHFYIHAVEAAHPDRAVPCAERIADLMPGAGHIVHMPSHVFIRVGRYADAIEVNEHAVHADEQHIGEGPRETAYSLVYYPHNYHFLSFAASMAGASQLALHASQQLAAKTDRARMRDPGFGALQHFLVTPLRVMVRFGLWQQVLAAPKPEADLLYPLGTWHYARGMALARTGRPDEAARELDQLRAVVAHPALEKVTVWDLNGADALLDIAERVLAGEIAAARGDYETAIAELSDGVRLETALTYDEPPPWDLPVRDVLGAVLLEAGRPVEAVAVYRAALDRFPENGWSLYGLSQSLEALGNEAEAAAVRERLERAWKSADVRLTGSRF